MVPRRFLNAVVRPNADELFRCHGDLRLAVNAILSLDAFFGILHAELKSRKHPAVARFKTDRRYRADLAGRSTQYRIFRDTAESLKHGELTRDKPRLVENVGQIREAIPGARVIMSGHDRLGGMAILIQIPASNSYERPEFIIGHGLRVAEDELAKYGL